MANMSAGFRSKQTHGYYAVTKVLEQASHVSDKTRKNDFRIPDVSDNAVRKREDISLTIQTSTEQEEDAPKCARC